MNEKVENLRLEHMHVIRADMSSMKEEMTGMRSEMLIIRQHMAGLMGAQLLQDTDLAGLKIRVDRIEKRLEFSE